MSDDYAVLGLDLSLTATGICPYIDDGLDFEPYTLKFGTRKDSVKGDMRLTHIRQALDSHLEGDLAGPRGGGGGIEYDLAVIESLPPYGKGSASLGLVHGVAREVLSYWSVPVIMVSPSALKKFSTGSGKASKEDMLKAFYKTSPWSSGDFDDNAVDSFFLQQVGFAYLDSDQLVVPDYGYDIKEQVKIIK